MVAAVLNLVIEQNATFRQRWVWRNRMKQPINLTGYTAKMQIHPATGTMIADLSTSNGGIVLGGVNGTIDILIEDSVTALMNFAAGATYDFLMIDPSGASSRFLQGKVTLSRGVTPP